ncbi:MAG: sigma 54-interacting transcriptional regulator, partial [Acidobacteriota bacterium]
MRPQLVIHPGGARQEVLQRTPIVLGRAPDCDVVLDDETVSRCHCRLSPAAGDNWQVEDLGSRGGTFLDGEAVVEPAVVPFGSWLRIGATVIQLVGREEGGLILSGEPIRDALLLGQLLDALGELAQAYDLEETLRALVDSGIRIGGGERGALFLSTAQDRLEVALARDLRAGDLSLDEVLTRSLPRRAVQANRPVVLADAGAAGREQTLPPSLHHSRRQSVVCVPLPGPDGARGVLYVDSLSPATRFGAAELTVLTALAVQASRAIDRAEERRREGEQRQRLEAENAALKARLGAAEPVAECAAMRRTLELLRRVAPSEATICLTGETGTGKEVMARHLHRLSGRAERPFIVVDCGALPESLI